MTVTRRGFIKRALTAAALALVPSLPGLPGVQSPKAATVVETRDTSLVRSIILELEQEQLTISSVCDWWETETGLDPEIMAALDQTECKHPFVVELKRGSCWNKNENLL